MADRSSSRACKTFLCSAPRHRVPERLRAEEGRWLWRNDVTRGTSRARTCQAASRSAHISLIVICDAGSVMVRAKLT